MQKIYNQYIRYAHSASDFMDASNYLKLYINSTDVHTKKAAEVAFIISYCRPFSGNKEKNGLTENISIKILHGLHQDLVGMHYDFLTYRNKLVAHSELSYMNPETAIFAGCQVSVTTLNRYERPLEKYEISQVIDLLKGVESASAKKAFSLKSKLTDGKYKPQKA
ncbi:MAG TPA: hypothetical protein VF433_09290 [Cellvibrio sp.]